MFIYVKKRLNRFLEGIKKIYNLGRIDRLMKKGVLVFGVLFLSFVFVLTIIRFTMIGGITGQVVQGEQNPVFSWRDFYAEINSVEVGREGIKVDYSVQDFTNSSQTIDVSFLIYENGRNLKSSLNEKVIVPSGTEVNYVKEIKVTETGAYTLLFEATNGRKTVSDEREFVFSNGNFNGDVIQEVKESRWKNVILICLGIILVFIVIIKIKEKNDVFRRYKRRHHKGLIHLDLHHIDK